MNLRMNSRKHVLIYRVFRNEGKIGFNLWKQEIFRINNRHGTKDPLPQEKTFLPSPCDLIQSHRLKVRTTELLWKFFPYFKLKPASFISFSLPTKNDNKRCLSACLSMSVHLQVVCCLAADDGVCIVAGQGFLPLQRIRGGGQGGRLILRPHQPCQGAQHQAQAGGGGGGVHALSGTPFRGDLSSVYKILERESHFPYGRLRGTLWGGPVGPHIPAQMVKKIQTQTILGELSL